MAADDMKKLAAEAACAYIRDGTDIGLGTGSTTEFAIRRIGELVKGGMRLRGVPTSVRTEKLAREVGIPLATPDQVESLDVTIDGADEVDPKLDLIKGLGGALLREKVVAALTKRQIIVVDESKLVTKLGTKAPLPVEVIPYARGYVQRRLVAERYQPKLRLKDGETVLTDNGYYVLDVTVPGGIDDARQLEATVNNVPGVVENGLFLGLTWRVIVGQADGKVREIAK